MKVAVSSNPISKSVASYSCLNKFLVTFLYWIFTFSFSKAQLLQGQFAIGSPYCDACCSGGESIITFRLLLPVNGIIDYEL